MPNVLTNFLVGIGIDFDQKGANEVTSSIDGIGKKALQVGGVLAGAFGIKSLTTDFADATNKIAYFSKTFGVLPNDVAALGRAAQHSGGSIDGMMSSLEGIEKMRAGLLKGDAGFIAQAGKAGIDPNSIITAKNATEAYIGLADQFQRMNVQQRLNAADALGLSEPDIRLLSQGSDAVRTLMDHEKTLRPITEAGVKAAADYAWQTQDLSNNIGGLADRISTDLLPAVTQVTGEFNKWVGANRELIGQSLDTVLKPIADNMQLISTAILVIGGAATLSGLGKAVGILRGLLFAPSTLLVAGGAAVYSAWDDAKGGNRSGNAPIASQSAEMRELDRLKRVNWARGNPGKPYPGDEEKIYPLSLGDPAQMAQSVRRPRASKQGEVTLGWMSGQFAALEQKYQLPAGLLRSVATTESGGDQFAQSPAGAKGLFQFMDGTARDMGLKGNDVFDPEKSADAAARYLNQLLQSTGGDLPKALAAYNWGLGNLQRKGLDQAPAETRQYIPKVLSGLDEYSAPAPTMDARDTIAPEVSALRQQPNDTGSQNRLPPVHVHLNLDGKEIDNRIVDMNERMFSDTMGALTQSTAR